MVKENRTREALTKEVVVIAEELQKLQTKTDTFREASQVIGDNILNLTREAYERFDLTPAMLWQDICVKSGYAHQHVDNVTKEVCNIEGTKPSATLKTCFSHIRKYFRENKNFNPKTMTELRAAIAPPKKNPVIKAVDAYIKLTTEQQNEFLYAIGVNPKHKSTFRTKQLELHKKAA